MSVVKLALPLSSGETSERLIDQGTLGIEVSIAGLAERYGRGRTSHTLHVWWARRPHSAMRSLVFETACKTITKESSETAIRLAAGIDDALPEAQAILADDYLAEDGPAVLDMFGGGGTIPFEAALLGARSFSIDYNALSVFIQTSNLIMSQQALKVRSNGELGKLANKFGTALLERVKTRTNDLYCRDRTASGATTFAYFWTYRNTCKSCGYHYLLSKRPWLAKRPNKTYSINISASQDGETVAASDASEVTKSAVWSGKGAGVACPRCDAKATPSIQDAEDVIVARGLLNKRGGKTYTVALEPSLDEADMEQRIASLLLDLDEELPTSLLPKWSGIVNPAIYGMDGHRQVFNTRQTIVYLELCKSLRECHTEILLSHPRAVADYIVSALSSLLDQFIDWNCRLSMWISQNEQVGRAFCGPGISMLWDYVETDCLENGPANLWSKLNRIISAVSEMPTFMHIPEVVPAMAQSLPFATNTFDVIVTDPPYYDNMFYNILSDFIYSWKRVALRPLFPNSFANPITDDTDELVASSMRQGGSDAAHEWYCSALGTALSEARRVLKPDGVLSFVYSHSSFRGWLEIVRAYRQSGLNIDSVEPLSIERRARPRAMTSEAINTCVVLVARKSDGASKGVTIADLQARVTTDLLTFGEPLEKAGWANEDIGLALFSRAASYVANAASISGNVSDEDALDVMFSVIKQKYPGFKLQRRKAI